MNLIFFFFSFFLSLALLCKYSNLSIAWNTGLRSLYTLISGSMAELEYLQPCVGAVLGFIGSKMVIEYFGESFSH